MDNKNFIQHINGGHPGGQVSLSQQAMLADVKTLFIKSRKFYPRQVLRRLQGEHAALTKGQLAALAFAMRRARKLGYSIMAGPTATAADLAGAMTAEAAQAVLANCTTKIVLRPSI